MKPTPEQDPKSSLIAGLQERVGQVIQEKWRIDALLGAGGMAAVYAATHRNGNRVAIKLLHPQYVADEDLRQRFLREGYVANLIEHPGVVRVLDDDDTGDGAVFLVMELLEGETLAQRLRREGRLPQSEVTRLAYELLGVLAAAHEKGIVHRDVKPDNLFVTRQGALKVLDFGIARLREWPDSGEVDQTRAGMLLGTPAYMAPEQALQHADEIDGQTDVWAVGATLFRLLTGRRVREGSTFNEQLFAAGSQAAPPLANVMPEVSPALADIVDRALAFSKAERWSSAAAMRAAIAALPTKSGQGPGLRAPEQGPTRPLPAFTGPTELSGPPAAMSADPRPPSLSTLPTLRDGGSAGGSGMVSAHRRSPLPAPAAFRPAAERGLEPSAASIPPAPASARTTRGRGPMLATLVVLLLVSAGAGLAFFRIRSASLELPAGSGASGRGQARVSAERIPPPSPSAVAPQTGTSPDEVAKAEPPGPVSSGAAAGAATASPPGARATAGPPRSRQGSAERSVAPQRGQTSESSRKRARVRPAARVLKPATELGQDDDLFGRRH